MNNLVMFCLSMESKHLNTIKNFNYFPVGLGDGNFSNEWFLDNKGENIPQKNKHYGEYTFHYWLWKNYLDQIDAKWIGFCQYKKFWSQKTYKTEDVNINSINTQVLKKIPEAYEKYETILTNPTFVNQWKTMKFIKMGLKILIKNPLLIFNKKKRNLNFHFDLMHGENNLSKAINLLDEANKNDFRQFVNNEVSFNPHIMIICKSKEKLKSYYEDVFPWLEKCEKIFGFKNFESYNKTRIYGFLAERFMSYWFQKNTKYTTLPVIIYDIRKDIS